MAHDLASAAAEPEGRRIVEETMASWALEGMEPAPDALERIRAFADDELSLEDAIAAAKAARR